MKNIVVLYHNSCHDGFGAAWSAWKKFGSKAEYIGVNHQDPPPAGLKGKTVYLLDFSYPIPETKKLLKEVQELICIDHHESVAASTKMANRFVFDIKHSGSVLAWRFFHKTAVPKRLLYIEDLDLWKKKLPHTEEARAALNTCPYDFKIWDKEIAAFEKVSSRQKVFEKGGNILQFQNQAIEKILKNAEMVRFCGYITMAANTSLFTDEVGSRIATKITPPIAIVWSMRSGRLVVSLRSNGSVDVSELAARFHGGGHIQASAFVLPHFKQFPWKQIKK